MESKERKKKPQSMFIGSRAGRLHRYNPADDSLSLVFRDGDKAENIMGLERRGRFLFVAGQTQIFKLEMGKVLTINKVFKTKLVRPQFHQMIIVNDYLYIAATLINQIWKFDLNLNLCERFKIEPPDRSSPVLSQKNGKILRKDISQQGFYGGESSPRIFKPGEFVENTVIKNYRIPGHLFIHPDSLRNQGAFIKYRRNYNHLNSVFYHNGNFHICLNWLTQKQYGPSGIAVLNSKMEEIDRFKYGWEAHNYIILENQKYVLCASSLSIAAINSRKGIHHLHKGGLLVDGKLVFEYNPDLFFCKDFSIDKDFIYIVGGGTAKRGNRNVTNGILFVLDRKFNHILTRKFANSGDFHGCLLLHEDFTKCTK